MKNLDIFRYFFRIYIDNLYSSNFVLPYYKLPLTLKLSRLDDRNAKFYCDCQRNLKRPNPSPKSYIVSSSYIPLPNPLILSVITSASTIEGSLIAESTDQSKIVSMDELSEASQDSFSSSPYFSSTKRLLDLLIESRCFFEFIARSIFKGILQELSKIYSAKQFHGNLALENVYLDHNYRVILREKTTEELPFADGVYVDMFCMGEILFSLVAGFLPFSSPEDESYKAILDGNWQDFWKICEDRVLYPRAGKDFFNSELRDLVKSLFSLSYDPALFIDQLNGHPWMEGMTMTNKQLRSLFNEYHKKMKKTDL